MNLELISFISVMLLGCNNIISSSPIIDNADMVVVSRTIPQESTNYLVKKYFVVGNDTSYFSCIFFENKKTEKISIRFENNNEKYLPSTSDSVAIIKSDVVSKTQYAKTTYKQQINQLEIILRKSIEDFDLKKLQYIGFELLSSGDLAIVITNEYVKEFGMKITSNYKKVGQILLNSQLGIDLNLILDRYSISVEQISIEQLHFVTRSELNKVNIIETDSTEISNKILNCFVNVKLKKK